MLGIIEELMILTLVLIAVCNNSNSASNTSGTVCPAVQTKTCRESGGRSHKEQRIVRCTL